MNKTNFILNQNKCPKTNKLLKNKININRIDVILLDSSGVHYLIEPLYEFLNKRKKATSGCSQIAP